VAIEMDMRQPALSRTLGLERGTQQFSRVLEGTADPADHMVRYRDNLAFGISRAPVRNPSELLHSETARQALADLERRLEPTVMIFDMPPMLACDDMLSFAGNVDCVLLVAAAESTSIREIDICERDLAAQTNVLGVALNKCRYTDTAYGGYYD
jgi:Mrp family chromosome partitioning ATPase